MNWLDPLLILLLSLFVLLESKRGFAMSLADFFGTVLALKTTWALAPRLVEPMAETFRLSSGDAALLANASLFTLLMLAVCTASKVFCDLTMLTFDDTLDSLLGVIMGVVVGIAVLHGYLTMFMNFGVYNWQVTMAQSTVARELLYYYSYQHIIAVLTNLGSQP